MTETTIPAFPAEQDYGAAALQARLAHAEAVSGADLGALGTEGDAEAFRGNIENLFGFVALPVGLAGPLVLKGEHAQGAVMVPLATTEGTLVASYNRGMRAIRESGGALTAVLKNEIYSSATFVTDGPEAAGALADWIAANHAAIAALVAEETAHGRYLRADCVPFGARLIVNLVYDPADAMGINMITSASHAVCGMIATANDGLEFYLPSALQGDKKATAYGYRNGRGRSVRAQLRLRAAVIGETLHASPEAMLRYHRNNVETAALAGGFGFNMHIANGITALGLATGQDVAYVGESANGLLVIEPLGDDLLLTLTIPSLYVGTVGGGTGLPTHRPCLEMMGCQGPGSALKLAEIFAGTCLAGEISVLAAIASDQFVRAHDKLGRNRPGAG
jgi:hydroxymethylglutaryl-CoA reductase (NADPH)